jgi:hypothetical protein
MHAVVTQVSIDDDEAARQMLQSDLMFESEDAANSFVQQFESPGPPDADLVKPDSLEVREVAGNA